MNVSDAIVIGAGPAGSIAARQLARAGAAVTLMDRAAFPRDKVCGGCLNQAALDQLDAIGLGDITRDAPPTRALRLHAGTRGATLPVRGVAISRRDFDMTLIERAMDAGVTFLPETHATLGPCEGSYRRVGSRKARVVLIADGLGGSACNDDPHLRVRIARRNRMGVSATLECAPTWQRPGTIDMCCGRRGYVGMVRLEDDRLHAAAAMQPAFVRDAGGPGAGVMRTLESCGINDIELRDAHWRGVGMLTRRRANVAASRTFVIGDAAGYVEPFTGEGMAWAITGAVAVTPLALHAMDHWDEDLITAWGHEHRRIVARRQWTCRLIATALRRPLLMRGVVALLAHQPALARPIIDAIQHRTRKGLAT